MRHPGYKHTQNTLKKLSEKAKLRGNNGWLGRKHRPEAIKKMRLAAIQRWKLYHKKECWVVEKKEIREPVAPQTYEPYQDIYMEGWEGIKDIL